MTPPRVLHVATADVSLTLLLGPQMGALVRAGYEVFGASAPAPYLTRPSCRSGGSGTSRSRTLHGRCLLAPICKRCEKCGRRSA